MTYKWLASSSSILSYLISCSCWYFTSTSQQIELRLVYLTLIQSKTSLPLFQIVFRYTIPISLLLLKCATTRISVLILLPAHHSAIIVLRRRPHDQRRSLSTQNRIMVAYVFDRKCYAIRALKLPLHKMTEVLAIHVVNNLFSMSSWISMNVKWGLWFESLSFVISTCTLMTHPCLWWWVSMTFWVVYTNSTCHWCDWSRWSHNRCSNHTNWCHCVSDCGSISIILSTLHQN